MIQLAIIPTAQAGMSQHQQMLFFSTIIIPQ